MTEKSKTDIVAHTATIVAAYLARHTVDDLETFIRRVHGILSRLPGQTDAAADRAAHAPAVPVEKSVMPDYIICLEDGKKLKMLKRYLKTTYGMTPAEYRRKWDLPDDYPMTAPNYAKRRSNLAKQSGLGKK